jgi:hypothetical protein
VSSGWRLPADRGPGPGEDPVPPIGAARLRKAGETAEEGFEEIPELEEEGLA